MREIIFSSDGANVLNAKVQKELAPYLFLCCNYNPQTCSGLSDDGKFYPAVLNLYNFAFDSSCIIRDLYRFQPSINVKDEYRRNLKASLDTVENLRSCFGHNNSELNGLMEADALEKYHQWIQSQIGKPEPDCPADYSKLFEALKIVATQLYNAIEKYIDAVPTQREREDIIHTWKEKIIRWYTKKGVKQNIFLGELYDFVLAKSGITDSRRLKILDIACLVKEYYTKESQVENLRCLLIGGKNNSMIEEAIDKREKEIKADIEKTELRFNQKSPFCYIDRLFEDLPKMLHETIDKERCSMLPNELLQIQISELFDNVSLPAHLQ